MSQQSGSNTLKKCKQQQLAASTPPIHSPHKSFSQITAAPKGENKCISTTYIGALNIISLHLLSLNRAPPTTDGHKRKTNRSSNTFRQSDIGSADCYIFSKQLWAKGEWHCYVMAKLQDSMYRTF